MKKIVGDLFQISHFTDEEKEAKEGKWHIHVTS